MSLNKDTMKVSTAMRFAKEYYDDSTYDHVVRVAGYVAENEMIPSEYRDECVALAFMHDLLEDTEYKTCMLPEYFEKALILLTKNSEQSYEDYCKEIRKTDYTNWRMCAYWVKLADIKDHLNQVDTLTDYLKKRYLSGLRYLL